MTSEELKQKYHVLHGIAWDIVSCRGAKGYKEEELLVTVHNLLLIKLIDTLEHLPRPMLDSIGQTMAEHYKL